MATTQPRIMRAYAILAKGDQPKPLGDDNYLVKSQSGNGSYLVLSVMVNGVASVQTTSFGMLSASISMRFGIGWL